MMHTNKYMTTKQVMELFGLMGATTLWRWRIKRGFPEPAIKGRPNRWLVEDIENWEREQRRRSMCDAKH